METKSWLNLAIERFKSESPLFFRKIIRIGLGMVSFAIAGRIALASIPDGMPIWITSVLDYMFIFGSAISGISKLATTDRELSKTVTGSDQKKIEANKIDPTTV